MTTRRSVRIDLMVSFAAVAFFVGVSILLAFYTFAVFKRTLYQITEQSIPPMALAYRLAAQSERVVASAPSLIASRDEAQRQAIYLKMITDINTLSNQVTGLKSFEGSRETAKTIETDLATFIAYMEKIDQLVGRRLALIAQAQVGHDALLGAYKASQEIINPAISVAIAPIGEWFSLESGGSNAARALRADQLPAISQSVRQYMPLIEMRLRVNALTNLLLSVPAEQDSQRLSVIAMKARALIADILDNHGRLPPAMSASHEAVMARFTELAEGGQSLVRIRWQELDILAAAATLTVETRVLSDRLSAAATELVLRTSAAATAATQSARGEEGVISLILLIVGAASLTVSILMGWVYVGSRVIGPIESLSRVARAIEAGDLDRQAPVVGNDEISGLAQAFNSMVRKRNDAERRLQEANEALERRVLARTKELSEKNRRLNQEILERECDQLKLRESELRFRELFDNMSSGVAIYDSPDDGGSFYLKDLNRAGLHAGNKQKAAAVGREVREVFPGIVAMGLLDVFSRVWQTGAPERHPSSLYKDAALVKWMDNYVCKLPSGELVAIFEDTTARRQAEAARKTLEAQLFQARKLESIGNLAGGIAHDFNNILASVIGFAELALEAAPAGSQQEDHLREVLTAGNRAKDLVRQILTFARQADEAVKPVQVSRIAGEALAMIRATIPALIDIQSALESRSLVMADPIQMHQVFLNLFTNAAHAMEDRGGRLRVDVLDEAIDPGSGGRYADLSSGDYLKIVVADTGTGISEADLGSIFDPYFTTKPPGAGTGMGLATVHGIVKKYGGEIWVDSAQGRGTVVTIVLPVVKAPAGLVQPPAAPAPARGNERILLVDDEPAIAKAGCRSLECLGYAVTTRTSSVAALELFAASADDFDLVITDMTMPSMTGERLAAEMMRIRPDIPIILCTGYSKKISEDAARRIGIRAFAFKPIVRAELAATVRKVLDS